MEEDTSHQNFDDKLGKKSLKNDPVPAPETNGITGSNLSDYEKAKELSSCVAPPSLNKSDEASCALTVASSILAKPVHRPGSSGITATLPTPSVGQSLSAKAQHLGITKYTSSHSGTNGNNNNNNVENPKTNNLDQGIDTEASFQPSALTQQKLEGPGSSFLSGSREERTNSHTVPSPVSTPANSAVPAHINSQGPFSKLDGVKTSSSNELSGGYVPTSASRVEDGKVLQQHSVASGGSGFMGLHQHEVSGNQRLSLQNSRPLKNQRLSPAHLHQMSTSDFIHSASSLIHGSDMQRGLPHQETTQQSGQSALNEPTKNMHDSAKNASSPRPGNLKCQDVTSNQLKNYLMSPSTNSSPSQVREANPRYDQPLITQFPPSDPHPMVTQISKPEKKPPRKRKSKANTGKGQSVKSSPLLTDYDDDDNDFIPVGMVQLSTLRRPVESNPVQQPNQLDQSQNPPAHARTTQQNLQVPPDKRDIDSRSKQHQLLLHLVQQAQQAQQQKILEQQRQQQQHQQQQKEQHQAHHHPHQQPQHRFPQLNQPKFVTHMNTNIELQKVHKNQHFQQESDPSISARAVLGSESHAERSGFKPSDQRILPNPQDHQIPTSSFIHSPSHSSSSYTAPLPHTSQAQNTAQNPQQISIPKIAEQLLQKTPSDQQLYLGESGYLPSRDDQRASKVELFLLHSKSEGPQPGSGHSLQSPSPTWQTARPTTPTISTIGSGQHSHQHPEISRMLCSPVSPRLSASSPHPSVSPRRTESPFQPPSSPCQFVSPKQPVSPLSRIVPQVSAATVFSSKAVLAGQNLVRNSNQPSNPKKAHVSLNSSNPPPATSWQPISPSLASASNIANFTHVQKPHPTVGQVKMCADQGQGALLTNNPIFPPSSMSSNPNLSQTTSRFASHTSDYELKPHHSNHPPPLSNSLGTNSLGDSPSHTGQSIHHLPGPVSAHLQHIVHPTLNLGAPKPSALNASPIWQQTQPQPHPYQEAMRTGVTAEMTPTSELKGLVPSKPVDIQRLSQQQQLAMSYQSSQLLASSKQNLEFKEFQVSKSISSGQPVVQSNAVSLVEGKTTLNDPSQALNIFSEKGSRLMESFFPSNEMLRPGQVSQNHAQIANIQQNQGLSNDQQPKLNTEEKTNISPQDIRKNDGALQVLSEIASERYVQAVELEKHNKKEEEEENPESRISSAGDNTLTQNQDMGGKVAKPKRGETNLKGALEKTEKKPAELINEIPKREVRQRKPKKPFEQEETPPRRNVRNTQNPKGSTETPLGKRPASPSRSHKKGQQQIKKVVNASNSKSDTELDAKTDAGKKGTAKAEAVSKKATKAGEEEVDSESEEVSDTESSEPRRLSRRLQVKKEERLKNKNDGKNAEDDGSNQRRSRRIATRIDYKEENSEHTSEESNSGQHQQQKTPTTELDKSTGSLQNNSADKVLTRSRNAQKDVGVSQSTGTNKKEDNAQKSSESLNLEKMSSGGTPQNTLSTGPSALPLKPEPTPPSERKMRARNRSKSRSRSPLTVGVQEPSNTPLTRRNMATRQVTSSNKNGEDGGFIEKRIAPTEFIDELPPFRRKHLKKDEPAATNAALGSTPQSKLKQAELNDKLAISEEKSEKHTTETDKAGKSRRTRKAPGSQTKQIESENMISDVSTSVSEAPITAAVQSTEEMPKSVSENVKTVDEHKIEVPDQSEQGSKPMSPSLLKDSPGDMEVQVASVTPHTSLLSQSHAQNDNVQDDPTSQQIHPQIEKLSADQTQSLLGSHAKESPQDPIQSADDRHLVNEVDQSKPRYLHRSPMVVYKLVPVVADEDTLLSRGPSSLLPVSGYFMSGSGDNCILLPENFMQGEATSQETARDVLKAVIPVSGQQLLLNSHLSSKSQQQLGSKHFTNSHSQVSIDPGNGSEVNLCSQKQTAQQAHRQHQGPPPISPLRTALSSPLNPQFQPSSSPAVWSSTQQHPHLPSPAHQGQWVSGQSKGSSTASSGDVNSVNLQRHTMIAGTPPPPPHSPHLSSTLGQSQQQVPQAHIRQHYQHHQSSPAPPYRPSPSWNPTPPSMPSSSPQLPSSSSSLSSVWNLASPSSVPQQQQVPFPVQHQQPVIQEPAPQHQKVRQTQHQQQLQLPLPPQHQQGHQQSQQQQPQQPWISPQHQLIETDQRWRSVQPADNAIASAAVESWSKEFLPSPPVYESRGSLTQQQRRANPGVDVRLQQTNQMSQQSAVFSQEPHEVLNQPSSTSSPNMFPPQQPQQRQQQQQQQDSSEFSDAKADQIIQNFLRSGSGFGQDLTGFNLGQQDMAYLDSRLRLSPNSLVSAVVAAYEEDQGANSMEQCDGIAPEPSGTGGRGRGSQNQLGESNNSLQDTINLVHTVNLVDLEEDVNLGLGGLSASHSGRSSGLDCPLMPPEEQDRSGSFQDPAVGSLPFPQSRDEMISAEDPTSQVQPDKEKASEEDDKSKEDEKAKPKDRKHQYRIVHQDGQRKFECLACAKVFSSATIYRHLRTHDPDHKVMCKVCGRDYTQRSSLIMHMVKNHGYIHTKKTEKKKINASSQGEKEDESSFNKEGKKSSKSSKSTNLSSTKKNTKSPSGSAKSSAEKNRQRRSSSQSPSNPLAPGLDQEERQIHQMTQRQVEEQRRLKAEQKQRKAAGELTSFPNSSTCETTSAASDNSERTFQTIEHLESPAVVMGEHSTTETKQQGNDQAASLMGHEKGIEKENCTDPQPVTEPYQTLSVSTPGERNESVLGVTGEVANEHPETNVAHEQITSSLPNSSIQVSENSKIESHEDKERQTSSSDLDALISAVAKGTAGCSPVSIAEDVSSLEQPSEGSTESSILKECLERESGSSAADLYSPIHRKDKDGKDRFGCPLCSRTLASRASFSLHMRRHKDEKTKVCKFCSKTFHTGQELKSHERTHTGERPYKCEICYSTFSHFGSALIHKKSHASRGETEPFPIVNGEIQYPASFKKPRTSNTEGKDGTGSPKRKRSKKTSGDQSAAISDSKQEGTLSGSGQPLRRSSMDVSFDREESALGTGVPNRRHSLNDKVLAGSNAMDTGMGAFGSPVGSSTPYYRTPPAYGSQISEQGGPTSGQSNFYNSLVGFSSAPAGSNMAKEMNMSRREANQLYTQTPARPDHQERIGVHASQDGYFSPQHQGQPVQSNTSGGGNTQPTQDHREPPPGYRPRLFGGLDDFDQTGQPFKSSSPSTEIVKSLLQHYNLPETQPNQDYAHQTHYPQEQQIPKNMLAYSEQVQQAFSVEYSDQQQQSATDMNFQDPNLPSLQNQPQQFYNSTQQQQQQLQQPPSYPGTLANRSGHFSPQHQQSPQHQTFNPPQQSPQHQTFNPPQHQNFNPPHQSPQHQNFNPPHQSPQHQTFNPPHQSPQHQNFNPPHQSPQHQMFNQQQQPPHQSPQHQISNQQQHQQTFPQQQQPQHILSHLQQQQQSPQMLNLQQQSSVIVSDKESLSQSPMPQKLQPLPKISSLARDMPR